MIPTPPANNLTTWSLHFVTSPAHQPRTSPPAHPATAPPPRQFRPPMNAMSIEMPAGLIDAGEDPQTAALRELYEETGYVGEVKGSPSPPIALSPGLTNERVCIVQVEVDMSLAENMNPTQVLSTNVGTTITVAGLTPPMHSSDQGLPPTN